MGRFIIDHDVYPAEILHCMKWVTASHVKEIFRNGYHMGKLFKLLHEMDCDPHQELGEYWDAQVSLNSLTRRQTRLDKENHELLKCC